MPGNGTTHQEWSIITPAMQPSPATQLQLWHRPNPKSMPAHKMPHPRERVKAKKKPSSSSSSDSGSSSSSQPQPKQPARNNAKKLDVVPENGGEWHVVEGKHRKKKG